MAVSIEDRELIDQYLAEPSGPDTPPPEGTKERETYNYLASRRLRAQRQEAFTEEREAGRKQLEDFREEAAERLRFGSPTRTKKQLKRGEGRRTRTHAAVPAARAVKGFQDWINGLYTPQSLFPIALALGILIIFAWPVNQGETRAQLIWRSLTRGARIPLDDVGLQFEVEDTETAFKDFATHADIQAKLDAIGEGFWAGVQTQFGSSGQRLPLGSPAAVEAELQLLKGKLGLNGKVGTGL